MSHIETVIARSVSSEAIQFLLRGLLDCFASLAMTVLERLEDARTLHSRRRPRAGGDPEPLS